MPAKTYAAKIDSYLSRLGKNGTTPPEDKGNTAQMLANAFLWTEVKRFAEAKHKEAMSVLEREGILERETLPTGEHSLCDSQHFTLTARVSEPVRRFNADHLAGEMSKRFKISVPTAKEMIDNAKLPTKPLVSIKVIEKV